ncbi:MAG: hypothetical protein ACK49F_13820 [Bacteroidota bacterium]
MKGSHSLDIVGEWIGYTSGLYDCHAFGDFNGDPSQEEVVELDK